MSGVGNPTSKPSVALCKRAGAWARLETLGEAERHDLGHAQAAAAFKQHAKVDVDQVAAARVQQQVPQVPVAQTQQPAHLPLKPRHV